MKEIPPEPAPCKLCSYEADGALSKQSTQSGTPPERGWGCMETFFPLLLVPFACCVVLWQQAARMAVALPHCKGQPATGRRDKILPRIGKRTGWHTSRAPFHVEGLFGSQQGGTEPLGDTCQLCKRREGIELESNRGQQPPRPEPCSCLPPPPTCPETVLQDTDPV